MSSKGVSPVIASIILIAVTLAIAGMFSLWATSFVQTRQTQFEEQIGCIDAMEIDRRAPSLTFDNSTLRVIVINKGDDPLTTLKVIITYPTLGVRNYEPFPAVTLGPGEGKSLTISDNPETYKSQILLQQLCESWRS